MSIEKINIFGVVGVDVLAVDVIKQIQESTSETIEVSIMSPGGSVDEGLAIYSELRNSGKKIVTKGQGVVASIATVVFLAGDEGERYLDEFVDFMVHNSSIMTEPYKSMEADELTKLGEYAQVVEDKLTKFYSQKLNKSFDEINAVMDAETHFSGQEAIDFGFASKLLNTKTKLKAVALYNPKNMSLLKKLFKAQDELTNLLLETDGGIKLVIDKETLEEGASVWIADEDGNATDEAPDDGDHTLNDGKVITIEGGKITAIKEADEEPDMAERMSALEEKVEEKLDALGKGIADLSAQMGNSVDAQNDDIVEALNQFKKEVIIEAKASISGEYVIPTANNSITKNNKVEVYHKSAIALKMEEQDKARKIKLNA